jgi:hypothetical protein
MLSYIMIIIMIKLKIIYVSYLFVEEFKTRFSLKKLLLKINFLFLKFYYLCKQNI